MRQLLLPEGPNISTGNGFRAAVLVPLLHDRCGYDRALVKENFSVQWTDKRFSVPVAAFSSEPLDAGSACIAVLDITGSQSAQTEVERIRDSGAPVVLACRPNQLEWWRQGTERANLQDAIPAEDVGTYLGRVGARLNPRRISRAKTLGRVDAEYQLDFVDVGLLPLLEEQAGEKLTGLVESILAKLRAACGKSPDDKTLFKWVFRLLAGKLLRDKGVPGFSNIDLMQPRMVFSSVARHLGVQEEQTPPPGQQVESALVAAGQRLDAFSPLAHVTTRTLAHLYETGLLDKKKKSNDFRRKWGIHNTPWWLADYLVWKAIDWVRDIPLNKRRVLDPGCGAATLLVSSLTMLREVALDEDLSRDAITAHLRDAIEGFDTDPFGLEIARLSLTLADIPNHNGWNIEQGDMFGSGVIADRLSRCSIVFANPPYEKFKAQEKRTYSDLTQFNKAAELIDRLVAKLPPNGILGLVLPQGFLHAASSKQARQTLLEHFEIREITLFPDKVFNFSDAETCLLLARRRLCSATKPIRFRWVREPNVGAFEKDYQVTAEQYTTASRFLRTPKTALRIPQLDEVWESCRGLSQFQSVASISKGLDYKGRDDLPVGAVTISDRHFPGGIEGFAKIEPSRVGIHELPRTRWMNLDDSVIRSPRSGTTTGISQVLISYAPVSRGPWRLKAFIDRTGHPVTSRFLTVRPRTGGVPLELLWMICNSAFANAYMYTHGLKRDVLTGDIRSMPVPLYTPDDALRIQSLVQEYTEAAIGFAESDGPSLILSDVPTAAGLDQMLKRIDAEILRLYQLPPRLERQIIDLFDGLPERKRPGVLPAWSRYYPEQFEGPASYHEYLGGESLGPNHHPSQTQLEKYLVVIRDDTLQAKERASLLLDLARSGDKAAAAVVLDFFSQPPPESHELVRAVLIAAEETRFPTPEQQQRVRTALWTWASELRKRADPRLIPAIKSAIRRYATLVPESEIGNLTELLSPVDREGCWLSVCLAIQNVFGASPPTDPNAAALLSARILAILNQLVADNAFDPGEQSTLVADSLRSLVSLGSPLAIDAAKTLIARVPDWLRQVTSEGIGETIANWHEHGVLATAQAMKNAQLVLDELSESVDSIPAK